MKRKTKNFNLLEESWVTLLSAGGGVGFVPLEPVLSSACRFGRMAAYGKHDSQRGRIP